jgi:3-oxoacyl-[acyl-carrier protein] reductase
LGQELRGKTAVIHGAGGAIGGAVARAFAAEGAALHLTGHSMASVQEVADEINAAGHRASAAPVNALDETAIDEHLDQLTDEGETRDISFNAVAFREVQGVPLVDLPLEAFSYAIASWSQTVFLTSRAAARRMTAQGSGVILTVQPPNAGTALASGFGAAVAAIESVALTLAAEVGPQGVRVLIGAEQGEDAARHHVHVDAAQHLEVAVRLHESGDPDGWCRAHETSLKG